MLACSAHPLEPQHTCVCQDDFHLDPPQFVVIPRKLLDVKLGGHIFNFLTFFFLFPHMTPIVGAQ